MIIYDVMIKLVQKPLDVDKNIFFGESLALALTRDRIRLFARRWTRFPKKLELEHRRRGK